MTEQQLQDAIVELAGVLGWRVYHTHDSRHSAKGFPDLCMVRPPRLVFAELKADGRNVTAEQADWLRALGSVGYPLELADEPTMSFRPVETNVWYPHHWLDGTVERVLREGGTNG